MNMSPEFGRLKEPEEPGKERVKWLNNRELHTILTDLEAGKEDRHRGKGLHNTKHFRSKRMKNNSRELGRVGHATARRVLPRGSPSKKQRENRNPQKNTP